MSSPQPPESDRPDQDESSSSRDLSDDKEAKAKELEELEKGFHETMKSIQTIKDCKEIMGSLQDYILELLTSEGDLKDDDGEEEEAAGVGGPSDTLFEQEKDKLKASKEDAAERYELFKQTLAEGAKETFKCDMRSIDDEIQRIKKDLEEMQGGFKLIDEAEEVLKTIKDKEFP